MSAPNFCTMREFPLFVAHDVYYKECPCCGMYMGEDAENCECGESLDGVEARYSEFDTNDLFRRIESYIQDHAPRMDFLKFLCRVVITRGCSCILETSTIVSRISMIMTIAIIILIAAGAAQSERESLKCIVWKNSCGRWRRIAAWKNTIAVVSFPTVRRFIARCQRKMPGNMKKSCMPWPQVENVFSMVLC